MMCALFSITFLLATLMSQGEVRVGYAITAGLFAIADAIVFLANKFDKK